MSAAWFRQAVARSVRGQLIGTLAVSAEGGAFTPSQPISQTSFLKVKTLAATTEDVRFRLVGRLEALQPVLDAEGKPTLDAKGRWAFTQYNLPQESEEIVIPAGTAIRFEPGVTQRVHLVPLAGAREVHGLSLTPPGRLDAS